MKKTLVLLFCMISLLLFVTGCGGGGNKSSQNSNIKLSVTPSYNFITAKSSLSANVKYDNTNQPINIDNTNHEMFLYNELCHGSTYTFTVNATDENGKEINIDGSQVSWSCDNNGQLGASTGASVELGVLGEGKYNVRATYNGETAEASVYFYKSKVLRVGYDISGEYKGIVFNSDTVTDDENIADLYLVDLGSYYDIRFYAPEGIYDLGDIGGIRNISADINTLEKKQYVDIHDSTNMTHSFIVKCKNGNYAKFTIGMTQHGSYFESRYCIYYKYISDGVFSDL